VIASILLTDLSSITINFIILLGLIRPIVTLGMGPDPGMIGVGLGVPKFVRMLRGGRTALRNIYGDKIEEFKIAVGLVAINGKELIRPIITNRKYSIEINENAAVRIQKGRIEKRPRNIFKVAIDALKIRRGS